MNGGIGLRKTMRLRMRYGLNSLKRHQTKQTVTYTLAVEEALCFGWIDSMVKNIDAESYTNRFSPRKKKSKWPEGNKLKALKLIHEGRMTPKGLESLTWLKPKLSVANKVK